MHLSTFFSSLFVDNKNYFDIFLALYIYLQIFREDHFWHKFFPSKSYKYQAMNEILLHYKTDYVNNKHSIPFKLSKFFQH